MDVKTAISGTIEADDHDVLEVPFTGQLLLERSVFNKGTAFTPDERRDLGLLGLLPPHQETLDQQVTRAYEAYQEKTTDLERHIYLRQLQDSNGTLFYRMLLDHLQEMMPIIYTPTVGLACQRFSHIMRRPRGLFIAYPERGDIDTILENASSPQVEVIVVTDGERILGLGDQGAGGMGIPIGKLSIYIACGGIHPATTLPILLDPGTNNQELLDDPLYIGWRHERITGAEYDSFVNAFVQAVKRRFPGVLLQWEDFAQHNANRLLQRYRDQLCTFNDDIQGTAAVTTGALLAAVAVTGRPLREHPVAILGAGSAGCGIAEQLVAAMMEEGLSEADARSRFFLIDRQGLLHDGMDGLQPFQRQLTQPKDRVISWRRGDDKPIELLDVIEHAHPTILIGVSGQPHTFTEEAIRAMARYAERPIVFPLSNPTSRVEATPADLIAWTDGRALIATGSPFDDVEYDGRRHPIAQCNNSYIFPGVGLGVRAVGARWVSDAIFMAAARALADTAPARRDPAGALLPPLSDSRPVARTIAIAVAEAAQREGLADLSATGGVLESIVNARVWYPRYRTMRRKRNRAASRPHRIASDPTLDATRSDVMPIMPNSQYETLTAMITPAIFLTANASLIISTSNRMSRVVDRIRVLNDLMDKMGRGASDLDYATERIEHLRDQLRRLEWRNDRIRYALTTLYIAFTTFVGTSLILAVDALVSNRLIALPTILAVTGVGLLLFASVNLALEALEALRTDRLEIRFYRELFDRRLADGRAAETSRPEGPRNGPELPRANLSVSRSE